ncbi:MAG: membrane protein insertion efficiency factor YidD [Pedobacter sp.]|jgi:putative membrane protein insertion efficiency factor|nr:MAG: membrane protein insertion efficiency factor YidD [Pedobacter sp.]
MMIIRLLHLAINCFLLLIIRLYQYLLSPLLGASCRYIPTCSEYGATALKKYGPFKGSWLTLKRLARCHPWGKHGQDFVP